MLFRSLGVFEAHNGEGEFSMKSRAAILFDVGREWSIEDVTIDDPGPGEVLVKTAFAGMCHSDEHIKEGDLAIKNDDADLLGMDRMFPLLGGHEGAGVVVATGPGTALEVGDHIAVSFVPSCGRCRYCSTGQQNLCDLGAKTFTGGMIADDRVAHHLADGPVNTVMAKLGTFSEYMLLNQDSAVKIDPDLPLDAAAIVSCGVATGWGSAVHRAEVTAGDTVVIVGSGGVGINSVQGARMAGAKRVIAVDPVEFKREKAMEMGATHTYSSIDEAVAAVAELTWGQGADSVILTVGLATGDMIAPCMAMVGKGGTLVVTSITNMMNSDVQLSLFDLAMMNKEIKGTIFGSGNPRFDIPNLLSMYREGALKLDELITTRYSLDQINQGYDDMNAGKNIRGIIEFSD